MLPSTRILILLSWNPMFPEVALPVDSGLEGSSCILITVVSPPPSATSGPCKVGTNKYVFIVNEQINGWLSRWTDEQKTNKGNTHCIFNGQISEWRLNKISFPNYYVSSLKCLWCPGSTQEWPLPEDLMMRHFDLEKLSIRLEFYFGGWICLMNKEFT